MSKVTAWWLPRWTTTLGLPSGLVRIATLKIATHGLRGARQALKPSRDRAMASLVAPAKIRGGTDVTTALTRERRPEPNHKLEGRELMSHRPSHQSSWFGIVTDEAMFAVELRLTLALRDWPLLLTMLASAGERVAVRGELVRCLSGTYLPDEGRLLCVFAAPSAESVREVLASASLSSVWIRAAVPLPVVDPLSDRA